MMRGLYEIGPVDAVDAYMGWWTLAGVDAAVGEVPVNWLRPVSAMPRSFSGASAPAMAEPVIPDTLETFHAWLADSASMHEATWGSAHILPSGAHAASLMILCDMPDIADGEAGMLLSGEAGALADAMLAAIGLARTQCYVASLAMARPPGGIWSAGDEKILAGRMRRHIALAAPRRVLLLGEKTSRALLAADAAQPSSALLSLNHEGGIVPAIAIRHPRFLLKQPAAKAESWRTLQRLIEKEVS